MRVAVVEPYLDGSHRAWAMGYAHHSSHAVEVIGLPGKHWKWRMQGAHVPLATRIRAAATSAGGFDALLVSAMTNLPGLLGLTHRDLGDPAVALYVHENQLTFPHEPNGDEDLTYAMINWTSMVAADLVVFNSEFHRDDWFGAVPGFLQRFPDHRRLDLVEPVRASSCVAPVGVDVAAIRARPRRRRARPLVLWNQRWEQDQSPDDFVDGIIHLTELGVDFEIALAGDRPIHAPASLRRLRQHLGDRVIHDGLADLDTYHDLLRSADIVVSTARHEFFGVAITEAIVAGAFPVLPRRVVYPERIPAEWHRTCLFDSSDGLIERMRWALEHRDESLRIAADLATSMEVFDWRVVAGRYDTLLSGLVARAATGTA